MKKTLLLAVAAAIAVGSLAIADLALADGNVSCPASLRSERKPVAQLTSMLKAKGWVIRKLQLYNNCYEVYGFDEKKKPVEAFFDPKTLDRVAVQP
jgi:hypothetical protein